MPRKTMTDETTSETTVTIDNFKESIINLGIKLCDDVQAGRARNLEELLSEISKLYTAIK